MHLWDASRQECCVQVYILQLIHFGLQDISFLHAVVTIIMENNYKKQQQNNPWQL